MTKLLIHREYFHSSLDLLQENMGVYAEKILYLKANNLPRIAFQRCSRIKMCIIGLRTPTEPSISSISIIYPV